MGVFSETAARWTKFAGKIEIANDSKFAVVRLSANGMIDSTFGQMGLLSATLVNNQYGAAHTLLIDTIQHKIYLGGVANGTLNHNGGIFRFCLENSLCVSDVSESPANHQVSIIFPNPSSDFLNINWEINDNFNVIMTNSIGQIIHDEHLNNTMHHTVNISHLEPGIYRIQLIGNSNTSVHNFIKI